MGLFGLLKRRRNVELSAFSLYAANLNSHTPDLAMLEEREHLLLFVTDDMQRGHHNHKLLGDSPEFVMQTTTFDKFSFWRKEAGLESYPIALRTAFTNDVYDIRTGHQRGAPPAPIRGELFKVRPETFLKLDKHRLNGVEFKRERVKLNLNFRWVHYSQQHGAHISERFMQPVRAFMYVGIGTYWMPQIDNNFSPIRLNRPVVDKDEFYYSFLRPSKHDSR